MARGGARPGAGRKPQPVRTVLADPTPVQQAERTIRDKLPWLVDRLMELAEGVRVEQSLPDGSPIVYQRPPDRAACEYLMDRIMGKPTQPVDVRDRAQQVADALGIDVREVIAEAERIAAGRL